MNPKRMHPVSRAVVAALLLSALCAVTFAPRALGQPQGASPPGEAPAEITVIVPEDAAIFFDGDPTRQRGTERRFFSPPLEIGRTYHYAILARWQKGGQAVEQTRKVLVTGGGRVRVDFLTSQAEGQDDQEVVTSKAVHRPTAASVDFRKDLNLSFATLRTLGPRIDAARRAHDPVALANLASELSVAESVAGKKASVTSDQLIKDAQKLAKMRNQLSELNAILKIQNQITARDEDIAITQQSIAEAKAAAASAQESVAYNQEPTWTPRKVLVNNYSSDYMDLWVNGHYKGQVQPGMSRTFIIEHRWNPTVLTAYGDTDNDNWGPRYIWGRFQTYTWNIQ
jgi:uncharacterized protein (TIGR03000 family)